MCVCWCRPVSNDSLQIPSIKTLRRQQPHTQKPPLVCTLVLSPLPAATYDIYWYVPYTTLHRSSLFLRCSSLSHAVGTDLHYERCRNSITTAHPITNPTYAVKKLPEQKQQALLLSPPHPHQIRRLLSLTSCRLMSFPPKTLNTIPCAPVMGTSSSADMMAPSALSCARFLPLPLPMPIIAVPAPPITDLTSHKTRHDKTRHDNDMT